MDALVTGDLFDLLDCEIKSSRRYDVVWLQNVLEHVIEPVDLLASLNCLVPTGGVAVITVPNDFSVTQREALRVGHIDRQFWVATPDHLSYFNYVSLQRISEATGWQCSEIFGDFPIDWFLFHSGSNYIKDKALGKSAHTARMQLENLIHGMELQDVLAFWSAAGKIGLGRNITAFFRKE